MFARALCANQRRERPEIVTFWNPCLQPSPMAVVNYVGRQDCGPCRRKFQRKKYWRYSFYSSALKRNFADCVFFVFYTVKKKTLFERVKQHFLQSPPLATRANSYGSTRSIFVHLNDTWPLGLIISSNNAQGQTHFWKLFRLCLLARKTSLAPRFLASPLHDVFKQWRHNPLPCA